jgi:hypothetical protein
MANYQTLLNTRMRLNELLDEDNDSRIEAIMKLLKNPATLEPVRDEALKKLRLLLGKETQAVKPTPGPMQQPKAAPKSKTIPQWAKPLSTWKDFKWNPDRAPPR